MVKVFSLLQDALLVRSSPVLQLIQQSTRKVTSLSPNIRPVLPTALVSQHRPLSTPSTDHVTGHVRDHPLYAVPTTCYHSKIQTRRKTQKQSHQLRYSHTPIFLKHIIMIYCRRRPLSRLPEKRGNQPKVRTPSVDHKVWVSEIWSEICA